MLPELWEAKSPTAPDIPEKSNQRKSNKKVILGVNPKVTEQVTQK